jgi:hypothetical protein
MSLGRIHYVLGTYFIGLGTLALLTTVGILPDGPSTLTVGFWLKALGVGLIPLGIYDILTVRRRRGLPGATGAA